jgi:Ser/Thr protein kinase RdoA (MazF antagonist)
MTGVLMLTNDVFRIVTAEGCYVLKIYGLGRSA